MKCNCRKCGNTIDLKMVQILTKRNNMKWLFLCQQCNEIEIWKTSNRNSVFGSGKNCYGEYRVNGNSFGLAQWIEKITRDEEKLLRLYKIDGTKDDFYPIKFVNDYLWCNDDEYDPAIEGSTHKKGQKEIRIPINEICKLKTICWYDDYVAPDVVEPVYGYKGVTLCNGILGDGRYIYELGIPCQEEKRNPFKTDFQDVYSHFCSCMEDVLFRWERDFISSTMKSSAGLHAFDTRLFKVKGEGHCFKTTQGGWVSNKLTLIKEVSQKEVIEYFSAKPELIEKMIHHYAKSKDSNNIWLKYINTEVKPYTQIVDQQEIEKLFIDNCEYRKIEECGHPLEELNMDVCKQCRYYPHYMAHSENEYNYLMSRSLVLRYDFDESCSCYQDLMLKKAIREISAIQRMIG